MSAWQGKRVVVTGAGGFIGSHLTQRLAREGARTTALVRYNSEGRRGWLDEIEEADAIEVVAGDIRDPDLVATLIEGADVVFHLAALIGIPYSYQAPTSYVRVNVEGTLNVLQASRRGVGRVVHTSTSEVYGTARRVPIDEAHPLQGQSPYSASKIGADMLAESYHRSFGLPVVTVRPFNTYGPRQSARAVIPTIVMQSLSRDRIQLGSLTPTRDLNFVGNTVDGFLAAAAHPNAVGEVFNIGSGSEISIGDLAALIMRLTGREVPIASDEQRMRPANSEVERLVCDASKARRELGWSPRLSLEDGLRETIDWIGRNISRFRVASYAV